MAILIKYNDHNNRILGDHRWNKDNGWIQKISDLETAANLLTYPYDQFSLAPGSSASKVDRVKLAGLMGVSEKDVDALFSQLISTPAPVSQLSEIAGLSDERAELFAGEFKIKTAAALAAVDDKKRQELISRSGASREQIDDWIEQAKQLTR